MNSHLTKQSYKSNVLKLIVYFLSSAMVDTKLHMICIWILLCAFCACPQGVCSRWWMEMFLNFATMCFFICLLKELGPEHAKSHWLHLLYFSPVCILKVSSNRLSKKRQSHIGCISFLQCVLSNVSLSWLPETNSHWLHLFGFSPVCVFKCLFKSPAQREALSHWLHLFDFSPLCFFKCCLKLPAREDV